MTGGASVPAVLVGGVSQLYQGDLDVGRLAVERLTGDDLPRGVLVEDLHYGAVAIAQRLEEVAPRALVLVGAEERGRPPGTVERRHLRPTAGDPKDAVAEAVQGYVGIDLVIDVAAALGALPDRVVAVELEPVSTRVSPDPSERGREALAEMVGLVRVEVARTPVHLLAGEVRAEIVRPGLSPSDALEALTALLHELERADGGGGWGRTFAERDRLRGAIREGRVGEGMTSLDWGLWWGLVEELDRLQAVEAAGAGR